MRSTANDDKSRAAYAEAEVRYRKSPKIALRGIKNYTELNFRSLGSHTRPDLDQISAAPTRSRKLESPASIDPSARSHSIVSHRLRRTRRDTILVATMS